MENQNNWHEFLDFPSFIFLRESKQNKILLKDYVLTRNVVKRL